MRSSIRVLPSSARLIAPLAAGLLAAGAAAGCARPSRTDDTGDLTALSVVGDSPEPSGSAPGGTAAPARTTGADSTGTTATRTTTPTTTTRTTTRPTTKPTTVPTTTATGGGARVASFAVRQKPTCQGPGRPGQGLVLAWTVTGAPGASLSEDGALLSGGLPAAGSLAVSFACDGAAGATVTHVFVLSAAGGAGNQAPNSVLRVSALIPPGMTVTPLS